jgi:hypothetical protein
MRLVHFTTCFFVSRVIKSGTFVDAIGACGMCQIPPTRIAPTFDCSLPTPNSQASWELEENKKHEGAARSV